MAKTETLKEKTVLTYHRENTYNVIINDQEGNEVAKCCRYTWGGGEEYKPPGYDEFYDIEAIEQRAARLVQAYNTRAELIATLKAAQQSIDILFAALIDRSPKNDTFYPSKSGQPWDTMTRIYNILSKE